MAKPLLSTPRPPRTLLWASLAVLLLLVATSCGSIERLQQFRAEHAASSQVPKELSTLWEVWQVLEKDYGGKEKIDQRSLSDGAIQGMMGVLGDKASTYLTPADYDLDIPNLGAVWQAWQALSPRLIKDKSSITSQDLQEAAIRGMLHALGNPYTSYLTPVEYQDEALGLKSKYEGIGVYVAMEEDKLTVVVPIQGSPAEGAGIQTGDVILEVDGTPTAGLSLAEATGRIRGPSGTKVELTILLPGEESPKRIAVSRDVVKQPTVLWEPIGQNLAYLRISQFLDDTDEDVKGALKEIMAQGFDGLILDLRRNPGGLVDTTVSVASQFLKDGLVMYETDNHQERTDQQVQGGGIATEIPMIVLTDQASASASEILAGSLQDHHRAVVIGTKTYGKGSVNELIQLDDGSGLYMTAALWYTPEGRMIEGEGLTPDIEVPMDLRIPLGSSFDWQLYTGIQYLQTKIAVPVS